MANGIKIANTLSEIDTECFIPHQEILDLLEETRNPDPAEVRDILAKAMNKERLLPRETATLLNTEDPELVEEIFQTAKKLKQQVYGNRIVLFAPLYVGNECINGCLYCGFRMENKELIRKTLTDEELEQELYALTSRGHKRLIVVFGNTPCIHPNTLQV